jgi:two-component system, OmpR family, response regulator
MAKTILVCDDQPTLRTLVRAALSEGDYSIVEARDGDEALRLVRSVRPDLVVLDMVMPGRSGLDVIEEIRFDARLSRTPVVLCSASRRSLDRESARDYGADRYLPKPFSPVELAQIVGELLGGRP